MGSLRTYPENINIILKIMCIYLINQSAASVNNNSSDNYFCVKTYNSDRNNDSKCEEIFQTSKQWKIDNTVDILKLWKDVSIPFVPTKRASDRCLQDSRILLSSLENKELWALKMFDSTAKTPSGILNGNVNQFGDYDQCLSIKAPVKGKYCLAAFDISIAKFGFSEEVDSLLHSHHWISSNLTDPGHRVPRVSSIYWGICLPASCNTRDVHNTLEDAFRELNPRISVEEKLCVTDQENVQQSKGKTITVILFSVLLTTITIMTFIEPKAHEYGTIMRILHGFSLKRNYKKFINTTMNEPVRGIDGIRALNALGLLITHKSFALFFAPYINRTTMAETFSMPWAVIGRTAIIYTDSFLLISGFLTARTLLKDLRRSENINFPKKVINRLFRILPTLICIILFCAYILPDLGSGPLWPLVVKEHSRLCKANMWKNFLFIHNYMGFENMCLTHTHQLGIDMQLFLVTPLFVGVLWKFGSRGVLGLVVVAAVSTILRIMAVFSKHVSMVIYFGMPLRKFFDSTNFSYILPTHRATIYLMGVGLAYFMTQKRSQIVLTKFQATCGWLVALLSGAWAMVGPYHMGMRDYEYEEVEAAVYSAISPISWGAFIAWCIWAASNDCAGWFGDFLSWRGFRMFTKIAYGVYLTQFPIFFYNIGLQRHAGFYKTSLMFDIPEFSLIFLTSTALALFVEMPFNEMCKVITEGVKTSDGKINNGIENSPTNSNDIKISNTSSSKPHDS